ncbi:MAG: tetratricopeptide repeat protein [Fimbriimonas sp.]
MRGKRARAWGVGVLSLAGAAWVVACGGDLGNSVHFNDVPDFGAPPPPLVIGSWEEYTSRPIPEANRPPDGDYEAMWKREEAQKAELKRLRTVAERHEAASRLADAAATWENVARILKETPSLEYELPGEAEYARDRAEILREVGAGPLPAPVAEYLRLRKADLAKGNDGPTLAGIEKLARSGTGGIVEPHALYYVAGKALDNQNYEGAAQKYEAVAKMAGPRREAALMMAIRSRLAARANWVDAEKVPPADVEKGRELIATLLKEFPNTRFRKSAEGWRTRADFLAGRRVEALTAYLRDLAATRDSDTQVSLLSSIRKVIESLTPDEAKALRATIIAQPDLLQPYLDYRLYHTEANPAQLTALVSFANEVLAKKPSAPLSSGVEARLAEIAYLQGDAKRAREYAERSLREPKGERADLAVFVHAAALHKLGLQDQALAALADYETRFKDSYLVRPALEQRAVIHERAEHWEEAIEDFRALNYERDIAYLIDVRLDPGQVEAYANKKGDALARLSAGYRRLRTNDFAAAIKWFSSVPDAERRKLAHVGSRDYAWLQPENAKSPLDQIPDPLTTARDLSKLQADKSAKGLYTLASYYYGRRNLLLYNAPLWEGGRGGLGWAWNEKIATPQDEAARRRHHFEHECLWRARVICLELAKRYPKDPYAARAVYRAATATRRLASFNPWWRSHDGTNRYFEAANLLKRVYTSYPRDPLAKNARKYEKVFRQEGTGAMASTMFEDELTN